jgi:bacterioferritin (cytochrome b1)
VQVSEVLSLELSSAKTRIEKMAEQIQCLEQTKVMAQRQHQLYEQEIHSLESQLEAAKKVGKTR